MGEVLHVLGEMQCSIGYKGKRYYLPILVGDYGGKLTLLRKNWLWLITLEWGEIFCFPKGDPVSSDSHLNDLLSKLYCELFTERYEGPCCPYYHERRCTTRI